MNELLFEQFISENPDYLAISHSQIENFERCHRYWNYVNMERLATTVSWPMRFSGDMLHPALGRWYESNGKETMDSSAWQQCWQKYIAAVEMIPCPKGKASIYSQQHASDIVTKYANMFADDFTTYLFVASEQKRYKVLPNLKVVYVSIPDLVLKRVEDDKLVVNDFKHSTWDVGADLDSFDRQLLGQSFVTGAEFLMKTHIFSSETKGVASFKITRPCDPVEPEQMSEWIDEVCMTADEIVRAKAKNVFVKHATKGCTAFNKKCEFKQLCSLGKDREFMIETLPKQEIK